RRSLGSAHAVWLALPVLPSLTSRRAVRLSRAAFFLPTPCAFLQRRSKMQRMNRRTFIGASVAATLSAAAKPVRAADSAFPFQPDAPQAAHSIHPIGLQLYTVRAAMKTDFADTIAKGPATANKEAKFAGCLTCPPKAFPHLPS